MLPQKPLSPNETVEVEVRILREGEVIACGVSILDREPGKPAQFRNVANAVQCGSYEILNAIWPRSLKK
jgi:hypothetical protein